ncbi:MAG: hypothetical protein KDA24_24975 [Deltaproteobacteria bacterium]|nr:hypothetical protein [Deltaproteobacteria bacterium]
MAHRLLRSLFLLLTLFLMTGLAGCDDSCQFANDGDCDENPPLQICATGTDTTDCRGGGCSDTCGAAFDGECDDGGPGSITNICSVGTDCSDCGPR